MFFFFAGLAVIMWVMQATIGAWFKVVFNWDKWTMPVKVLPALCTAAVLFSMDYAHKNWDGLMAPDLYRFAYIWLGVVFLSFLVSAAFFPVYGAFRLVSLPTKWMRKASLYSMIGLIAWALWGGYSEPKIKRIPIRAPQLPSMKIAVMADTHLGYGVSLNQLDRALHKLQAEQPDMLLLLGDIFEYGPDRDDYALRIASVYTPLGSYGVLGNHEYYVGYGDSKQFFQDAHVHLLENETIILPNNIQLTGLRDLLTARISFPELEAVLASSKTEHPAILLSHTPLYPEKAAAFGFDLMLSGHTHNGQIWPFTYLVKRQFPYIYGLYDVDDMPFYVTSGMFYWGIPMRLFAPKEIPILEINPTEETHADAAA